MEAANSAIFLDSAAQVARASKAWNRSAVLGIDTEFVRERTFYANIGLVQISDGQTVWLVDPLVEGATGPVRDLLENTAITKVIHSPSEDLDVLMSAINAVPEPMIDTQLACAMLGQPLQSGYHTAAEWLLGVAIDKDQTRSNWCARPLRQVQLRYAALDVCLLPLMWDILKNSLNEKQRLTWLHEDCGQMISKSRQEPDFRDYWLRIRGIGRLDGASLAILQSLAEWREKVARARNLPRGFIIKDPALLNISRRRMSTLEELEEIEELHPRAIKRHGPAITGIVRDVMDSGHELDTRDPLNGRERKLLGSMKSQVKKQADTLGIDPALLASKRDMEGLIENSRNQSGSQQLPDKLSGWRNQVIGKDLVRILEN